MSLERLIHLAQRTGDRLIVHNPHGTDVVIMSVEAYEELLNHELMNEEPGRDSYEYGDMSRETDMWHSAEDIIEQRYRQAHQRSQKGKHDHQYREEDWEEAVHPHEQQKTMTHSPVAVASTASESIPQTSQAIRYHQNTEDVIHRNESGLDEPVFYEEPV